MDAIATLPAVILIEVQKNEMAGTEEVDDVVPAVVHLQPVFFEELGF
jgi:hypothetical protein